MENSIGLITSFVGAPTGNWLVNIISFLVKIGGSVAVGVILFTLALKIITLPFDILSRRSTRRNAIKMEEMRPELEKLQKQYADNKDLYSRKMMALYKQNGYSMFGACLPMILTLVIFIVAINGFTAYSRYANATYFYNMSRAYNSVIYDGFTPDGDILTDGYIIQKLDGSLEFKLDKIYSAPKDADGKITGTNIDVDFNVIPDGSDFKYYMLVNTGGYLDYKKQYTLLADGSADFTGQTKAEYIVNDYRVEQIFGEKYLEFIANNPGASAKAFLQNEAQLRSAISYQAQQEGFLWVKNIWVTDSPTSHPVSQDVFSFISTSNIPFLAGDYTELTAKLYSEKTIPNGYFILVALTALSALLTQFITSKGQKAQMELQTVDGQGASTQKFMMWVMPIMMTVFSFIYTAAFAIYMVLSSIVSVITTLLINYFVDKKYKVKATAGEVIRGRVYVPKKEEKPSKKNKQKEDKLLHGEEDFLSGKADKKKHIRGRFK